MTCIKCFGGILLLSACTAGLSRSPPESSSGVATSLVQSEYVVRGSTEEELLQALLDHGPTVGGLPVFASTEWEVHWRVHPRRRAGQCEIERVTVALNIKTVLPRWTAPASVTPELRADWTAFVAAVSIHERGHTELGARAADSVLRVLRTRRYTRGYSCDLVVTEAHAAAQERLDEFHEKNVQYDVDTAHGAAQGVRWPRRG
jgi:predicted secreted Zn-dependent protease